MRQLFPALTAGQPSEVSVHDAYDLPRPRPAGRPWVTLCMVASLDGSTMVDGSSRGLSSPTDQAVLLTMRTLVDAVLVGAGTVRSEGYGPPRAPGLTIVVVAHSGRSLDLTTALWQSGRALLALPEDAEDVPVPSVRAGKGDVDLAGVLAQLDARTVQAEGGARLNGALLAAGLVDELNLTVSPLLVGGDGSRLTVGASPALHRMQLAHVMEDDGFLFTRYVREPDTATR